MEPENQSVENQETKLVEGTSIIEQDFIAKLKKFSSTLEERKPESIGDEIKIIQEMFNHEEASLLAALQHNNYLNCQVELDKLGIALEIATKRRPNSGLILPN